MSFILSLLLFSGLNLYFLKDSSDLLVKIQPSIGAEELILYYSFSGTDWDSVEVSDETGEFVTVLKSPEELNVVGLYFVYKDGAIDDNNGELYLFEVKKSPRFLLPFSLNDLEVMIGQARKKIVSGSHVDEAVMLLDYIDQMLKIVPVIKNSPNELKRNILRVEAEKLRTQLLR